MITVEVDREAEAAYITLREGIVSRTVIVDVDSTVLVDIDAEDHVLGVELLDLETVIPVERLKELFRLSDENVKDLEGVRERWDTLYGDGR